MYRYMYMYVRVVLLEYLLCLNDNLCLLKRPFDSPSASLRYTFLCNCILVFGNVISM